MLPHAVLLLPSAACAIALLVLSVAAATGRSRWRLLIDRLILAILALLLVAAATGIPGAVTGNAPRDALHVVYGVAAVVVLPIARFAPVVSSAPQRALLIAVGCLVLLGLLARLAMTGRAG